MAKFPHYPNGPSRFKAQPHRSRYATWSELAQHFVGLERVLPETDMSGIPVSDIELLAVHPGGPPHYWSGLGLYRVGFLQTSGGRTRESEEYFLADGDGKIVSSNYNVGALFKHPLWTEENAKSSLKKSGWGVMRGWQP